MNVAKLIARLADVSYVGRADNDRPFVRVHLASASFEGVLRKLDAQLVELKGKDGTHFLELAAIVGVTLVDVGDARDLISGGEQERAGESPGGLAVRRRLAALSELVGFPVEAQVPGDDVMRLALWRLIDDVQSALRALQVAQGELEIDTVVIKDADASKVAASSGTLTIFADLAGGPRGRLDRHALEREIANAL